jgi:hypothetical protein
MHLISETALNFVDGTMGEAENRFWTKHVDSCSPCAVEVQEWAELAQWVKGSHLLDAPEHVLAQARGVIHVPLKTPESRPSLGQIFATIIFDSFAQPAWAGVRAPTLVAGGPVLRQLVLRAEDFDIHIRMSTLENHRELLGQILPRGNSAFVQTAKLHLRQKDERVGSTTTNDLGEFRFNDIPDGSLSLQVDLPNRTLITALVM